MEPAVFRARSAPTKKAVGPHTQPPSPRPSPRSSSLNSTPVLLPPPLEDFFLASLALEKQRCRREVQESMDRLKVLEAENKQILAAIEAIRDRRDSAMDKLTEIKASTRIPVYHSDHKDDVKEAQPIDKGEVSLAKVKANESKLLTHVTDPRTGIEVKDRWWRMRMYPACFIGSEMVDWLIAAGWAKTRDEGVEIGRYLSQRGKIYHSMKDNVFEDGFFYYRFKDVAIAPRQNRVWKFPHLVRHFSVALSARLAHNIEHSPDEVSCLQYINELRQNVLYLSIRSSPQGAADSMAGWNLRRSHNNVNTYLMDKTLRDPITKERYNSRVVKTVGTVKCSPQQFVKDLLDFKTRKKWDALFSAGQLITRLSPSTQIVYRASTSPIKKSIWPRDVVALQDTFVDPEDKTHVVYEISVEHQDVPAVAGFIRAEVLLIAHVLRPIEGQPEQSELTLISQVDFKDLSDSIAPEWLVDKWTGLDVFGILKQDQKGQVIIRNGSIPQPDVTAEFPGVPLDPAMGREKKHSSSVGTRDFVPLCVLGRGAYSKIMLVRLKSTGAVYAMKILRKNDIIQSRHVAHVMTERNILSTINHPFIVRLYYSFQSKTRLYMVMSYCAGGDLFTYLRRKGLPETVAAFYTAELVLGLRQIHSLKIAHRDVKPENILFSGDGHVLLADFGLSKENMGSGRRTLSLSGTSEYLAPEMILNKGHGRMVDWWQLGVVLHEMLTGKHPFYSQNPYRMHQNVLLREPALDPRLSPEAKSLLKGFFVKDPSRRLGSEPAKRDIESHPFFKKHNIDWTALYNKEVTPPYKPNLKDPSDVSHFEDIFTKEKPIFTPSPVQRLLASDEDFSSSKNEGSEVGSKDKKKKEDFEGFSYDSSRDAPIAPS